MELREGDHLWSEGEGEAREWGEGQGSGNIRRYEDERTVENVWQFIATKYIML